MRVRYTLLALSCVIAGGVALLTPTVTAQAPARAGDLAQVMRGILFPNSNIVFDAQEIDPAIPPKKDDSGSSTSSYSGLYGGWQGVENAAIAMAESVDLIMMPGRVCSNGKPVPVGNKDWVMFANGLREAAQASLSAARAKDQDKILDAAGLLGDACYVCHEVYRDRGPAGGPARCTAP